MARLVLLLLVCASRVASLPLTPGRNELVLSAATPAQANSGAANFDQELVGQPNPCHSTDLIAF